MLEKLLKIGWKFVKIFKNVVKMSKNEKKIIE